MPTHLPVEGVMGIAATEMRCYVIRPTHALLARQTPTAGYLLLGIAVSLSALSAELGTRFRHGLYSISGELSRKLCDDHLAKAPGLESLVRRLASQPAFLSGPDSELRVTLGYCTAIAGFWLNRVVSHCRGKMDLPETGRIWRRIFQPQSFRDNSPEML